MGNFQSTGTEGATFTPSDAFFLADGAKNCNMEVVRCFLKKNPALVFATTANDKDTAWHVAAAAGNLPVLEYLVKVTRANALSNTFDPVSKVVNQQNAKGQTALMLACAGGHSACAKLLLSAGGHLLVSDINGLSALHHAALNNKPSASTAGSGNSSNNRQQQQQQQRQGGGAAAAGAGAANASGSAQQGPGKGQGQDDEDCVEVLLAHMQRQLILQGAKVAPPEVHTGVIRKFVDGGDMYGRTALHYAAWSGNLRAAHALWCAGADIASRTEADCYDQELPCNTGTTPLHFAAMRGNQAVVVLLLAAWHRAVRQPDTPLPRPAFLQRAAEAAAVELAAAAAAAAAPRSLSSSPSRVGRGQEAKEPAVEPDARTSAGCAAKAGEGMDKDGGGAAKEADTGATPEPGAAGAACVREGQQDAGQGGPEELGKDAPAAGSAESEAAGPGAAKAEGKGPAANGDRAGGDAGGHADGGAAANGDEASGSGAPPVGSDPAAVATANGTHPGAGASPAGGEKGAATAEADNGKTAAGEGALQPRSSSSRPPDHAAAEPVASWPSAPVEQLLPPPLLSSAALPRVGPQDPVPDLRLMVDAYGNTPYSIACKRKGDQEGMLIELLDPSTNFTAGEEVSEDGGEERAEGGGGANGSGGGARRGAYGRRRFSDDEDEDDDDDGGSSRAGLAGPLLLWEGVELVQTIATDPQGFFKLAATAPLLQPPAEEEHPPGMFGMGGGGRGGRAAHVRRESLFQAVGGGGRRESESSGDSGSTAGQPLLGGGLLGREGGRRGHSRGASQGMGRSDAEEEPVPDCFLCPLTCKVFRDPVVAADGVTYERDAIERHLRLVATSPVTKQRMPSTQVYPNGALKRAIEHWRVFYGTSSMGGMGGGGGSGPGAAGSSRSSVSSLALGSRR